MRGHDPMPRISQYPAALTPAAIRQCTFTVRPPSRTFQFSASIQQTCTGRRPAARDPSASSSSSAAIADTCDFDRPVTPGEAASFSTRRAETPSRYDVATTKAAARPARRRCSRNAGKYDPDRSFGTASSIVPARVSRSRRRYPLREFTRGHLPVARVADGPRYRRPSSAGRTPGSSPAARPGSPRPASARTSRPQQARCYLRPLRSHSSLTTHLEGSRGGRFPIR